MGGEADEGVGGAMTIWALSMGFPAMLWGLGLASLPILIHLLNRHRHQVIDWAAMKWLLAAVKKRQRSIRLEQWLLLALRTLVLVLVILAMAKPTLEEARALFVADTPATHHILVFDNSMSMQYALANWNRWERAKGQAQAILDGADTGDLASVVVMGVAATILVGDPSPYLRDVTEEIDAIKPEHGPGRVEAAMDQVLEILKLSRATRRRVYFITDLQRSGWLAGDEGGANLADAAAPGPAENGEAAESKEVADLGAKLRAISAQADFTIVDVGGGEASNLAVVDVELGEPLLVRGRSAVVQARIGNFSPVAANDLAVELIVDGEVERSQTLSVPPGEQRTAALPFTPRDPGEKVIGVRLADDPLRVDNQRWLVARARESLAVLIVDGDPSGEAFQAEGDYLRVALAPGGDGDSGGPTGAAGAGVTRDDSLIQPRTKLESDLLETDLENWDMIALCNVGQLTAVETRRLEDYVRAGGGLVFFLGGRTNLAAYNERLFADGAGLLSARLLEVVSKEKGDASAFRFDPLGYRHPIVQLFQDREDAGLLSAKTQRYVRAKLPEGSAAQVALAFDSGDPAVIVSRFGRGRVGLVTTSVSLDWTNWPISHSFVPVVQELVLEIVSGKVRAPRTLVGEALEASLPPSSPADSATWTLPNGESRVVPTRGEEPSGPRQVVLGETPLAGVYGLKLQGDEGPRSLAVNTWPRESDLARLTPDDLRSLYPGWEFSVIERWEESATLVSAGMGSGGDLVRPLLYGALMLLFVETWLARRFSHHT